jgi:GNAT superfamily N-acetyltransferase
MADAIRLLRPADIDAASTLSNTAGWNQRIDDWRKLVEIAPLGSFCAVDSHRIVGTAIGIDYGSFGWIAMMLVDPAYRGRGLGAALLESAMQALPSGNPIRLDATPLGRPLYQRYGFTDESMLTRRIAAAGASAARSASGLDIRGMTAADLSAVTAHDAGVFGANRAGVLSWMLREAPHYAHVVISENGAPQYALGRPGRLFDHIGPVVARDDTGATALVAAAVRAAGGRPLVIDAFDERTAFSSALQEIGLAAQRPLFRMSRPADTPFQPPSGDLLEYAILGPEFG